jgi:hypothetical protein
VCQGVLLESDRGLEQILREHTRRGWLAARSESSEGIGCLVVSSEDMMKLKTIEFLLQRSHLLSVSRHAGITTVRLSHYLIDDELRVSSNIKLLNPEFGSDA